MLAAFQGFTVPHGGKKSRQDVQVIYGQLLIDKYFYFCILISHFNERSFVNGKTSK